MADAAVMQQLGRVNLIAKYQRASLVLAFVRRLILSGFCFEAAALSLVAQDPVVLPIEVAGENGETVGVSVGVTALQAGRVRSLWMQVHGLEYPDMASVRVNSSEWFTLNNQSVAVAEPAKSYGGIGGGFATLKLTLALQAGAVVGGSNVIRFRFNHSDGVATGFRVLAFNFITETGQMTCASNTFVQEDPNSWVAPLCDSDSVGMGKTLWRTAALRSSSLPGAKTIQAHCSDCHARDGRDLKYFNFSNRSIIARARFHGLSLMEGKRIASYIRSLETSNPGRPWNPPYQPGPGLDERPVSDWAAGAGLEWAIDKDEDTLFYIFSRKNQERTGWMKCSDARDCGFGELARLITPTTFRPDADLNPREIPISLQLPDWNHWLPRVHPLDAWGSEFINSDFARIYGDDRHTDDKKGLRKMLASREALKLLKNAEITRLFDEWSLSRVKFLRKPVTALSVQTSSELTKEIYSAQLWQLVKAWELAQEFNLEYSNDRPDTEKEKSKGWLNTIPEETAPAMTKIPDGPNGMGGSALVNEYFDNSWYELQLLLNNGNHRHTDRHPIDWVYFLGRFLALQKESNRPEPGRATISIIKAFQSTDPAIGPRDENRGWRPEQNVAPTIMISEPWQPVFQPVPVEIRRAIIDAMLAAWLDKNTQYPIAQYFEVGRVKGNYKAPVFFGAITGDGAWNKSSRFREAGARLQLVRRLTDWGADYSDMAARFSY